jgi:hypothetical protein
VYEISAATFSKRGEKFFDDHSDKRLKWADPPWSQNFRKNLSVLGMKGRIKVNWYHVHLAFLSRNVNPLTRTERGRVHQSSDDIGVSRDHPETSIVLGLGDWTGFSQMLVDLIHIVMIQTRGMMIEVTAPHHQVFIRERLLYLAHAFLLYS